MSTTTHHVAPWPITDAMIDAAAPYCPAQSRDLAHAALAAARNAAPAPAPADEADTRRVAGLFAGKTVEGALQEIGVQPQWRPAPHTVPQLQAMRELARESPEAQSTVWWVLLCRMVERRCGVSREAQEALGRTESPLVPTPWN